MIKIIRTVCLICVSLASVGSLASTTPIDNMDSEKQTKVVRKNVVEFVPELQRFNEYLGGWTASFAVEKGQAAVVDVTLFEKVLNGKALKTTHSINNGVYGGESYVFWSKENSRLEFYYFTTADFITTGWMEFISDSEFVAYEEVSGESSMSQGISRVKSTSKLMGDKMTVATSYLKNGKWTTPEVREYTRTIKDVIFQ